MQRAWRLGASKLPVDEGSMAFCEGCTDFTEVVEEPTAQKRTSIIDPVRRAISTADLLYLDLLCTQNLVVVKLVKEEEILQTAADDGESSPTIVVVAQGRGGLRRKPWLSNLSQLWTTRPLVAVFSRGRLKRWKSTKRPISKLQLNCRIYVNGI
ncbi:unnamed protein product [Prunus armeniaca]